MILSKIQTKPRFMNHYVENFGIYFIGIEGKEEQTFDSNSWRNPQETLEVFMNIYNERTFSIRIIFGENLNCLIL